MTPNSLIFYPKQLSFAQKSPPQIVFCGAQSLAAPYKFVPTFGAFRETTNHLFFVPQYSHCKGHLEQYYRGNSPPGVVVFRYSPHSLDPTITNQRPFHNGINFLETQSSAR